MKLTITQIVLEHAEFKHRPDYLAIALNNDDAAVRSNVNLTAQVSRAEQNPNGAALVRLGAKSAEDSLYQFELGYAVFYSLEWQEGEEVPEDLDNRLMVTGSTMLLPFIREVVASLTGRGRFGPTWLAPTNFNELFRAKPPEAVGSSGQ
jgi:preprotein translocase subunit SecB